MGGVDGDVTLQVGVDITEESINKASDKIVTKLRRTLYNSLNKYLKSVQESVDSLAKSFTDFSNTVSKDVGKAISAIRELSKSLAISDATNKSEEEIKSLIALEEERFQKQLEHQKELNKLALEHQSNVNAKKGEDYINRANEQIRTSQVKQDIKDASSANAQARKEEAEAKKKAEKEAEELKRKESEQQIINKLVEEEAQKWAKVEESISESARKSKEIAEETPKRKIDTEKEAKNRKLEEEYAKQNDPKEIQELKKQRISLEFKTDKAKLEETLNGYKAEISTASDEMSEKLESEFSNSYSKIDEEIYQVIKRTEDWIASERQAGRGSEELDSFEAKFVHLKNTITSTGSEFYKLSTTPIKTDELKSLESELEKVQQRLIQAKEKVATMEISGQTKGSSFEKAKLDAEILEEKFDKLSLKLLDLINEGKGFTINQDSVDSLGNKLYEQYLKLNSESNRFMTKQEEQTQKEEEKRQKLAEETAELKKQNSVFDKLKNKMASGIKSIGKGLSSGISGMLDKIGNKFKQLTRMVGRQLLRKAINAIIKDLTSMVGEIAKVSPEFNKSLSKLKSSANLLGASLVTAVTPIINFITPALVKLMDMLSEVAFKVQEFFAVLTGQKTVISATKVNADYASSLDKTSKSAKNANKQLAKYDNLLVITKNKDNDDSTPSASFNTVNVDPSSAVSEFAEKLKEAWRKADFTEIGEILRDKIVGGLNSIPWETIQSTANKVASSIGTLINGLFNPKDGKYTLGESVGNFIATSLNTAVGFLDTFVWTINTENIGINIGTALQNAFTSFDWGGLGSLLSGILVKGLNLISGFIKGIDWASLPGQIKDKIVEFFKGIEWEEVSQSVGDLAGSLLNALFDLTGGLVKLAEDFIDGIKNYFAPYISTEAKNNGELEASGKSILGGILEGIIDAMKNIGSWIYEHIIQPFLSGFASNFGVNTESFDETKSYGGQLIAGLLKGISEKLAKTKLGTWIKENIVDPFLKKVKEHFGIASPSKKMSEIGGYLIDGLKNGIGNIWKKIKEKFTELKTKLKDFFTGENGLITKFKTWASNIPSKLVSGIGNLWNAVKQKFTDLKDSISKFFKDKLSKFGINIKIPTWKEMKSKVVSFVSSIVNFINTHIIDKLNNLLKFTVPDNKATQLVGLAGKSYTLASIPHIPVPKLAEGAVIPPNKEFLAMLGDQKRGVNIETPLDTMIKAFLTALDIKGIGGSTSNPEVNLYLDKRVIAKAVWEESNKKYKQTGKAF